MNKDSLQEYRKKRDFRSTPEPDGNGGFKKNTPLFVVQKHEASSLHYDFRLEVDGVLKSWAVPKGPSTDPRQKRLALPTEDHPLEYADFEGVIPEDEYGGGVVMVWDRGEYQGINENGTTMHQALDKGKVKVRLNGSKLQGGYALIRTNTGSDERWLLIKEKDDAADARRNPVSTEPKSVLTGRTLKQIRKEEK